MKDAIFIKLTKKKKLEIKPEKFDKDIPNIRVALFIPLRYKNDGYTMCAFFVKNNKGEWYRRADYDSFRFSRFAENKYAMLKGDFENNGVQFFLGDYGNWLSGYGGSFERID